MPQSTTVTTTTTAASSNNKKKKGRPPAHQNKFAFKHNPKSKKTATILSSPIEHCCQRCYDKIEWRKKYRKYKPLTQPSTCNICHNRNITAAYHTVCDNCSTKSNKAKNLLATWNINGFIPLPGTAVVSSISLESNTQQQQHDQVENKQTDKSNPTTRTDDHEPCNDTDGKIAETGEGGGGGRVAKEEKDDNDPIIHRRVCTICFKAPALPASDDEYSDDDDSNDDDANRRRKLKLREIKSIRRQQEREAYEKRMSRTKKPTTIESNNNNNQVDEEEEEDDDDELQMSNNNDDTLVSRLKVGDDDDSNDDNDDDVNDPFLQAVGGKDKLLTGDAYQQMLLNKHRNGLVR
jgi:Uncharacterized conserved protein (DUF2039)